MLNRLLRPSTHSLARARSGLGNLINASADDLALLALFCLVSAPLRPCGFRERPIPNYVGNS